MIRLLVCFLLIITAQGTDLPHQSSSPLGLPATIEDLYIPGPEVEVIPRKNNESSLVIRILQTKPAANGFRYNLEIYALDPGKHLISDFLQRATDESPVTGLEATFEGSTVHPEDSLPKPKDPNPTPPPKLGGYRTLLIFLGGFWLLGLLAILLIRKKKPNTVSTSNPVLTPAEKIRQLVEKAAEGSLKDGDHARLERLLLGYWRTKIPEIINLAPAEALVELRSHPEASPLILKLEQWLHAPAPDFSEEELTSLLAPYHSQSHP